MSANEGGGQQAATAVANSHQAPTSITSSQVSSPMTSQAMSQHQMQLQHTTTTTTAAVHGQHQVHHHATAQGGNPMQQLQVIQQPIQNSYLPQLYNPNGQIMLQPGNIALHHSGINPQIQVITGKTFQQNQLGGPHMLTAATSYTALPTSASNNQAYIIGQLINSNPQLQQQISQTGKPGEMKNVITSPQLGTQLPQGLSWASPHTLFTTTGPNGQIFIRGAQPDQMFIQQQQPMHNAGNSHQHFSMPTQIGTTQIPTTSITQANTTMQQQQQQATSVQQGQQIQTQGSQAQAPITIQPQPTNVVSIKGPAVLQPKPAPLQIQPQPTQQQQQHQQQQHLQQQQLAQLQQVTMTQMGHQQQQIQMINQQGSTQQTNLQSISLTPQQGQQMTTTQVIQQAQQQHLQQTQARQLTILPQQTQQHIQQQMPIIQQQQQQQHQPIRPNYTVGNMTTTTLVQNTPMAQGNNQQKAKMKKPGAGRGTPNGSPQGKAIFQRAPLPTNISPMPQKQPNLSGATLMKVPTSMGQQIVQPLKTINLSALHSSTPNLPDATLTPLNPQQNIQMSIQNHQILYTASPTQMPSPNISITPTNMQPLPQQIMQQQSIKEEDSADSKGDTEKENNDSEDMMGLKQKLPKAMVKPQVLTHVIEGFVIQEAAEPFPMPKNGEIEEPPKKKMALNGDMGKCELCGKVDLRAKFKKGKRFCSSACVKEAKSQQQNQAQVKNNESNKQRNNGKGRKWENGGDETDETNSSIGEASHNEDQADEEPKVNPAKWSVEEVVDFVRNLPGCSEHAKEFEEQEIDGQALMLLKEDHLMSAMGMKLGPALKLCAKIDVIRGTPNGGPQPEQTKV